MCGIAGIYAYHHAARDADRNELHRIRDHMRARGPDGKGEWYSGDGRLALGHRRLSIIDLSERGAQPMVSANGKLVVTFNGEIYNYRTLRQDLESKSHAFRSDSDTEILLHLYAEKGEAMIYDLRGMFAFGLWDAEKRALLLARDPYGIKPLYYADDGHVLRFSSQVKALLAGAGVSRGIDAAGIVGFCLLGSVPEPFTTFRSIKVLPAGNVLWADSQGSRSPKPFFNIAQIFKDAVESVSGVSEAEQSARVAAALKESVRHHLIADIPVGAFLSAGVDSGTLLGLASPVGQGDVRGVDLPRSEPMNTITIAFEEFRGRHEDESLHAAQIAKRYGANHKTRVVTEAEFRSDLPKILAAMDQPTIDGINTWFASKAASELGLKVAISGLGGDELFGGYPAFADIPRWVAAMAIPSRIPKLGSEVRRLLQRIGRFLPGLSRKAAGMVEYGGSYPGAYLLRRGIFMPWELPELLGRGMAGDGLMRLQPLQHIGSVLEPDPMQPYGRVAALEASLYLRNQLLRDTDWASMAHSLEVRVPLVDSFLLAQLAPLLTSQRRWSGKRLMAASPVPPLPKELINSAKIGFTTPLGSWLERLDVSRTVPEVSGEHWSRRWTMAVLGEYNPTVVNPIAVRP